MNLSDYDPYLLICCCFGKNSRLLLGFLRMISLC